jgi:hypothetical protein
MTYYRDTFTKIYHIVYFIPLKAKQKLITTEHVGSALHVFEHVHRNFDIFSWDTSKSFRRDAVDGIISIHLNFKDIIFWNLADYTELYLVSQQIFS